MHHTRIGWIALLIALAAPWSARASAQVPGSPGSVSVATFGAKGDDALDDTEAFRQAVAALPPGGGLVRVPAGSYVLTGTIALRDFVRLEGEGAAWESSVTVLQIRHKDGPGIRMGSYCGVK
ncbi:MAG: hypothetical protein FJX72_19130, partial [Armatimonadetes bacterium]|nr:hypothetical protein [Armatimonadota bacterium]